MATATKKTVKPKKESKATLSIPLMDLTGKTEKEMTLPEEIFGSTASTATLNNYIRVFLNNQRKGTAATKTRSEVNYTTKKIYRQKGTGGARHGARKAPIFVGGGITFGPQPRDFFIKLNKKQKKVALFTALTLKNKDNAILGMADSVMSMEPKTKTFNTFMKKQDMAEAKVLIVTPIVENNNLVLSTRNISNISITDSTNLNPYIIMNSEKIIFFEGAIESLQKHYLATDES